MELTISIATENDADVLNVLINGAYRGDHSRKGWTTEADLLDGLRTDAANIIELMRKPNADFLKCGNDKEILGCVYLEQQQQKIYLGFLSVSPEHQAFGIGKKLLLAADDYAKEKNCTSVYMTVITLRPELIAWYKRNGYHETGETKPFPSNDKFAIPKQPLQLAVLEKNI